MENMSVLIPSDGQVQYKTDDWPNYVKDALSLLKQYL